MVRRTQLLGEFIDTVGSDLVSIVEMGDGWPSVVRLELQDEFPLIALHIGTVLETGRNRDQERRIENPSKGRSLSAPQGSFPVVIGVWNKEGDVVFGGMDAELRMSRVTRQSMFMPLLLLQRAAICGWAEHINKAGELIIGFNPVLFPAYVERRRSGVHFLPEQVGCTLAASGLLLPDSQAQGSRERRVSMILARSAKFSRAVIDAYGGSCAMCELGLGLVEGAHIYPVGAPDSPDEIWNGLALCGNHHSAFDRHLIWVDPSSLDIKLHPELMSRKPFSRASKNFLDLTQSELRRPSGSASFPRAEMFQKRYEFYSGMYAWASGKQSLLRR